MIDSYIPRQLGLYLRKAANEFPAVVVFGLLNRRRIEQHGYRCIAYNLGNCSEGEESFRI